MSKDVQNYAETTRYLAMPIAYRTNPTNRISGSQFQAQMIDRHESRADSDGASDTQEPSETAGRGEHDVNTMASPWNLGLRLLL
jgi:hypothetical protein